MSKILLLSHASAIPDEVRTLALKEKKPIRWIFLDQDYIQFLRWEKALKTDFEYKSLRQQLKIVSQRLRQPYSELIARLGSLYNSPAWWASRISERNTLVSSLFLHCCYLQIVTEELPNLAGTTIVISNSWALLKSLEHIADKGNFRIEWATRPIPGYIYCLFWRQTIIRTFWLVYTAIRRSLVRKDRPVPPNDRPCIFIHTYLEESCIGKDGAFHDRYFPGLANWLQKNGCTVVIIPVLSNLKRSFYSAWKWMQDSTQQFINPFKYYHFSDYILTLKEAWRATTLPHGQVCLNGLDVTRLFDAEKQSSAFDCLQQILYLRLPKRLSAAGFQVSALIAEYENMIPEKLLILGFRRYLSETKIIGYQNATLPPMILCLFITSSEAKFAPLPDRVVCNGSFFQDILVQEGLPLEKTVVGPSLRYAYLFELAKGYNNAAPKTVDIFVPLPLMIDDAVELFIKLIAAFGQKEFRVVIKPHPIFKLQELFPPSNIEDIPPNFEFVEGNMSDWVPRARVVITLSSSALYESLAAGVPVVVVGKESSIDFNPLGFYSDLSQVFYTPEQIYHETIRLLSLSSDELNQYQKRSQEILISSFNPVTEENMRVFLDGLI